MPTAKIIIIAEQSTVMDSVPERKNRPRLLTILCIISLFGGSWGLMSNLGNLENAEKLSSLTAQTIEETRDRMSGLSPDARTKKSMTAIFEDFQVLTDTVKIKQMALFGILSNLLTLVGAALMYRLRKNGFGIYLLGIAVYVAAPMVVYGLTNLAGISFFVFTLLISLIFSLLYARTRKYLS
jgi:hypothetical protein